MNAMVPFSAPQHNRLLGNDRALLVPVELEHLFAAFFATPPAINDEGNNAAMWLMQNGIAEQSFNRYRDVVLQTFAEYQNMFQAYVRMRRAKARVSISMTIPNISSKQTSSGKLPWDICCIIGEYAYGGPVDINGTVVPIDHIHNMTVPRSRYTGIHPADFCQWVDRQRSILVDLARRLQTGRIRLHLHSIRLRFHAALICHLIAVSLKRERMQAKGTCGKTKGSHTISVPVQAAASAHCERPITTGCSGAGDAHSHRHDQRNQH